MKTQKEHVENKGSCCPKCGSEEIEGGNIEIDDGIASQHMVCLECDADWADEYILTRFRTYGAWYKQEPEQDEKSCDICRAQAQKIRDKDSLGAVIAMGVDALTEILHKRGVCTMSIPTSIEEAIHIANQEFCEKTVILEPASLDTNAEYKLVFKQETVLTFCDIKGGDIKENEERLQEGQSLFCVSVTEETPDSINIQCEDGSVVFNILKEWVDITKEV